MEQHTEPTQEELDQFFKQCQAENDAEENWWIDQHNGDYHVDPPECFEDRADFDRQFMSPREKREDDARRGYVAPIPTSTPIVYPVYDDDGTDELPF